MREIPFGVEERDSKRSFYRIADPFLAFWFRFVDRHRSDLGGGRIAEVESIVEAELPQHVAEVHEDLCRRAIPRLVRGPLGIARRWWGRGEDGTTSELDVVAASHGDGAALVGEVKRTLDERDVDRETKRLITLARGIPQLAGRELTYVLFALRGTALRRGRARGGVRIIGPEELLAALDC